MKARSFSASFIGPIALTVSVLVVMVSPAHATAPSPVIEYLASGYSEDSPTWTNTGSYTLGDGTTSIGGMKKTTTGPVAVVFNGREVSNSDRVSGSIGSTASLSHVSVEMWLYMDDNGSTQNTSGSMLFSWNEAAFNYNVYHYSDYIGFNTFGSEVYGINATTLKEGWHHFVFVMNDDTTSAAGQKVYVDGVNQSLLCRTGVCSNNNTERVFNASGEFILMDNGYSANTWNAKGKLGLTRIYTNEISAANVLANYDATKATYQIGVYPPTVTLAAVASTSSSTAISFTVTGNEDLNCSTLSTTSGTDFTLTNISSIASIVQTSAKVCTINATSSATAGGGARVSTLTASGTFSIADTSGEAQTTLIGSPQSTTVTIPAGADTTAPTATLAATSATSTSGTITFTVTGNEAITCSTLSTTSGTDFAFTNISAITGIVQTSPTICTITATSTALANGVAVLSTLTAAAGFAITDTAGNAQSTLTGSPQSTTVTIADTTTTTTTTVPAPPPAPPPATTTTSVPRTRSLSVAGAAASYSVLAIGPSLLATPSAGDGLITWTSETPSICSALMVTGLSAVGSLSSVYRVGYLNTAGTCTITATIAATDIHDAVSTSVSFEVTKLVTRVQMRVNGSKSNTSLRPAYSWSSLSGETVSFWATVTMPFGTKKLLNEATNDVRFINLTPSVCSLGDKTIEVIGARTIATFTGSGTCEVDAVVPTSPQRLRAVALSSAKATLTAPTSSTSTTSTSTTTTTSTTSTTIVASSTSTTVSRSTKTSNSTTATTELQVSMGSEIVVNSDATDFVLSGESIQLIATNLNFTAGSVRIRASNGPWTTHNIASIGNIRLPINGSTTALELEFVANGAQPIKYIVPLNKNGSKSGWLNYFLVFAGGLGAMWFFIFIVKRRRRDEKLPPPLPPSI
jgi:hypothetical protein